MNWRYPFAASAGLLLIAGSLFMHPRGNSAPAPEPNNPKVRDTYDANSEKPDLREDYIVVRDYAKPIN